MPLQRQFIDTRDIKLSLLKQQLLPTTRWCDKLEMQRNTRTKCKRNVTASVWAEISPFIVWRINFLAVIGPWRRINMTHWTNLWQAISFGSLRANFITSCDTASLHLFASGMGFRVCLLTRSTWKKHPQRCGIMSVWWHCRITAATPGRTFVGSVENTIDSPLDLFCAKLTVIRRCLPAVHSIILRGISKGAC